MDGCMYGTIELQAKGVIFWQGEKRIPYGDLLLMKCLGCPRKKYEAAQEMIICYIFWGSDPWKFVLLVAVVDLQFKGIHASQNEATRC